MADHAIVRLMRISLALTQGMQGELNAAMTGQEKGALTELCRIYGIRPSTVASHPEHALMVLTALYGNLSIEDERERRLHRDGVLRETDRVWGRGKFFSRVQGAIALMMVQPGWFGASRSNASLTREFNSLVKAVFVLEILGVTTLLPMGIKSVTKGAEEAIKSSSIRKGIEAAKRRLVLGAGSGILEATATRMGMALGPWAVVAAGLIVVTYHSMIRRLETIRSEMILRVSLGRASQSEVDGLQNERFIALIRQALQGYWK